MGRRVPVSETDGIDTADVRAFCRTVDLGSMTAAARDLGETKGTVSRRVARLERSLGVALVQRAGRNVRPTDDGRLYRDRAGQALELLQDAADAMRGTDAEPTGHLRVTAPLGIGTLLLGRLVPAFVERCPGVTVDLVLTDAVLSFARDRIDVALRLSAGLPDSSLVGQRLLEPAAVLVASRGYLDRHGAPAVPEDLHAHRLLLPPLRGVATPMTLVPADGAGAPVQLVLRGRVLCHDLLLLREAALAGAGIAMVMRPMADQDVADGRLVEVLPDWRPERRVSLWLLTVGGPLPSKTRAFRDFVRAEVRGCRP